MIQRLSIRNFALIDELEIQFSEGFTIITGETGAGKSIILGALGLIAGNRAESHVLLDKDIKCVVEADFKITTLNLQSFFSDNDLDFDDTCIIRREILPNGKSRAFVNDTPVNLTIVKQLSELLIDIHSQHDTLLLRDSGFQLNSLDVYASNMDLLRQYESAFVKVRNLKSKLSELIADDQRMKSELDFFQYQYDELSSANLIENEKEELIKELNVINHAEDLKSSLTQLVSAFIDSENNIIDQITVAKNLLSKVSGLTSKLDELSERLESSLLEIKDIAETIDQIAQETDFDPDRLHIIEERLDLIHSLESKHRVNGIHELLKIQQELEIKITRSQNLDHEILQLKAQLQVDEVQLQVLADELRNKRMEAAVGFQKDIVKTLKVLGMPDASVHIMIETLDEFTINGKDRVKYLFTANKGIEPQELKKIASGGEISRFMLAVKAIISSKKELPTIIFDEIDTGVSGNIAEMLAMVMRKISSYCQILCITHLPQIASKGDEHWKVRKEIKDDTTRTVIKKLSNEERLEEIAHMLSGAELSKEAMDNAKVLLGFK